jgi:transcriptional regulator with XRE-family HTH domain
MESLKTLEMLGWNQGKIDEFRHRWNSADSASSHHLLCEEYGLGYKLAVNCFGMKVLRSHPRKISRLDWEKLKAEWIDPNGRSTSEIAVAYGVTQHRIAEYLGSRPIAQLMASEIQPDVDDNSSKYHVLLIKYGLDVDQITSIRTSWQNPECDHGQISEEFGVPLRLLELLFGTVRPRSLSDDQWKELKRRWFDRAGGSLEEICSDYNLDPRTPLTYLPRISEARKGRKASKLAKILSPEVYETLCKAVKTGEFTTYKALSEQYNIPVKSIVIEFGKCGDVKRRVVAPDCPLGLSKSQYVWAKKMWRSPQGFTAEEIAEKVGVIRGTLLKHFGPIKDRDRPKGISETKWEELKKKWCDPKGETRQKIAADFGIPYGTLNRFLPPCQSGRRKTQLSMRITPEKLKELRKRIETGNFKSFAALAREYNLTESNLHGKFGKSRDWKKRA